MCCFIVRNVEIYTQYCSNRKGYLLGYYECRIGANILFIDCKATYDSVNRRQVIQILKDSELLAIKLIRLKHYYYYLFIDDRALPLRDT